MPNARYDVIIIGTGAGGGTIAHALAASSARILIVERGDFVPQEEENWSPEAVWRDLRYRINERWLDERGREFLPYTHYSVGGNMTAALTVSPTANTPVPSGSGRHPRTR